MIPRKSWETKKNVNDICSGLRFLTRFHLSGATNFIQGCLQLQQSRPVVSRSLEEDFHTLLSR